MLEVVEKMLGATFVERIQQEIPGLEGSLSSNPAAAKKHLQATARTLGLKA
jgi:hypothetical protein